MTAAPSPTPHVFLNLKSGGCCCCSHEATISDSDGRELCRIDEALDAYLIAEALNRLSEDDLASIRLEAVQKAEKRARREARREKRRRAVYAAERQRVRRAYSARTIELAQTDPATMVIFDEADRMAQAELLSVLSPKQLAEWQRATR